MKNDTERFSDLILKKIEIYALRLPLRDWTNLACQG